VNRAERNEGECCDNSKGDQHNATPDQPAQPNGTLSMAGVTLKVFSFGLKIGRQIASHLGNGT
jgi:hypothetical protein